MGNDVADRLITRSSDEQKMLFKDDYNETIGKFRWSPESAVGGLVGNVGKVLDMMATPCATTPGIYARAFFSALPTLILTPIKPSPVDFAIIRIGTGHGKKRRKFFDVWDFEQLARVPKPGVYKIFFDLTRFGAMALWYFAILDAEVNFAVNWMSAIYEYTGCKLPHAGSGSAYASGHAIPGGAFAPGNEYRMSFWACDEFVGCGCGPTGVLMPAGPGGRETSTFSYHLEFAKWAAVEGPNPSVTTSLASTQPATGDSSSSAGSSLVSAGGITSASGSNYSESQGTGARQYEVHFSVENNWATITGGGFTAVGRSPFWNITADP